MAKAELGGKRRCLTCATPFYDLNRAPIVCPKCGAAFQVVEVVRSAARRAPTPFSRPAPIAPVAPEVLLTTADEEEEDAVEEVEADGADADEADEVLDVEEIEEVEEVEATPE